jgi:uncharacterized protein YdeI (YjbR/CyaY-like superfamily)
MIMPSDALPTLEFINAYQLRTRLKKYRNNSSGIWIRMFKKHSGILSVTFEEVLDEGPCFGRARAQDVKYEHDSYLQRFTPRKTVGTQSKRNLERIGVLTEAGKITPAGAKALGIRTQ